MLEVCFAIPPKLTQREECKAGTTAPVRFQNCLRFFRHLDWALESCQGLHFSDPPVGEARASLTKAAVNGRLLFWQADNQVACPISTMPI